MIAWTNERIKEEFDAELAQKWLAALRSGEYTQGRDRLRTLNSEFCCLGVACDIADSSQWALMGVSHKRMFRWGKSENTHLLGYDLASKIGLNPSGCRLDGKDFRFDHLNIYSLMEANDTLELPFTDIANMVENYYKELGLLL